MSFAAAVFRDGGHIQFHWGLEGMQMERGSYVDTRVDFEAEEE